MCVFIIYRCLANIYKRQSISVIFLHVTAVPKSTCVFFLHVTPAAEQANAGRQPRAGPPLDLGQLSPSVLDRFMVPFLAGAVGLAYRAAHECLGDAGVGGGVGGGPT